MSVYYVHAPDLGLVKIGYARLPVRRLHEIQVTSPVRVVLLAVEEGGAAVEAQRHHQFRSYRCRGEWFKHDGELKAFIEGLPPYVHEVLRKPLPGVLGAWITANRHGLASFGKLIDATPATVSRICAGKMSPACFVRKIYEATNGEVDANDLFGLPAKTISNSTEERIAANG